MNYRKTVYACYLGYITQAIINNLAPLLFVTFQKQFALSLSQVTLLILMNFGTQLLVDLISARFADCIGIRTCIASAHLFCTAGLVGLGIFPLILPPFIGLIVAVVLYAIGGGIIEVLISPIVEACPADNKESAMSLLHSFYCWGQMGVVLLSTAFFVLAGFENWPVLTCIWAILPLCNFFMFLKVPIVPLVEEGQSLSIAGLVKLPVFWILAGLMVCAGASELGMAQWASAFAETGLQVSKTMGDLLGPCMFALFMGISRVFYAGFAEKIRLESFILGSSALCIASYLIAALSPYPLLGLAGCALCGLSVGIMWPGVFSISAKACPLGGTAMFGLLALAGDLGCSSGPSLVGTASDALGGSLQSGIGFGIIFPILMIVLMLSLLRHIRSPKGQKL